MVHCMYLRVSGYNFKNILSEEFFLLSNDKQYIDPEEIMLNAAFYLGFYYLQKKPPFDGVSSVSRVKTMLHDKQYNS